MPVRAMFIGWVSSTQIVPLLLMIAVGRGLTVTGKRGMVGNASCGIDLTYRYASAVGAEGHRNRCCRRIAYESCSGREGPCIDRPGISSELNMRLVSRAQTIASPVIVETGDGSQDINVKGSGDDRCNRSCWSR
ncbi:MAG: hypothetical protein MZV63_47200 [Marinilabiliales bacterium]|nr:hypothetical protein [Marinilabiliales bacterium]